MIEILLKEVIEIKHLVKEIHKIIFPQDKPLDKDELKKKLRAEILLKHHKRG